MELELASLSARDIYGFMIQAIVPRPVAWVVSDNGNGSFNLAPFSFFNGVTSRPPTLSLSIGHKRDGSKKDTWRNIEERGHFVVHLARVDQAGEVSDSSASLPFGESEIVRGELALHEEPGWPLPRLADIGLAMLCRLYRLVEIGDGPQGLIIGEIQRAYIHDALVTQGSGSRLEISVEKMRPLARLGGDSYGELGRVFTVERPE